MEVTKEAYKSIGIHVITSIFTVDKGVIKVLMIKRKNEPYKGMWSLVGGALYNNEELITGAKREIEEKVGIKDINIYFSGIFDKVNRSPVQRMIAITYIGVLDCNKVSILKETLKTSNAEWFPIDKIPDLAYDHDELLEHSLTRLRTFIMQTDILKSLFPSGFTIPEIHKTYETILNSTIDRRNLRKKLLNSGVIYDTNKSIIFEGKKPAKLYKFKNN